MSWKELPLDTWRINQVPGHDLQAGLGWRRVQLFRQTSNCLAEGDAADAALLALMALWGPTPILGNLAGFGSAGDDDSVDTLWGGTAADAFFTTTSDKPADRNAVGYGPDLN